MLTYISKQGLSIDFFKSIMPSHASIYSQDSNILLTFSNKKDMLHGSYFLNKQYHIAPREDLKNCTLLIEPYFFVKGIKNLKIIVDRVTNNTHISLRNAYIREKNLIKKLHGINPQSNQSIKILTQQVKALGKKIDILKERKILSLS
ncbi:hypothetical protein [Candidatus Vidania fulgoroideorum]